MNIPQDAQKGRPSHPPTPARQDAPFRGQGRNSATDPHFTFHASRFTLLWNDARTPLAEFFSILLEINGDTWPQKDKLKRERRQS